MPVAERMYARALFEAARDGGRLEVVQQELSEFVEAVRQVPELRALLRDPQLDPRAKISALKEILAGADEFVRNFILLLTERGRATELEETRLEFDRLVAAETGRLSLELATAVELSDEEAYRIVEQIEKSSGRTVDATRRVDPDLLGGIVLQVGSLRLDASLRGRLERLRRELRNGGTQGSPVGPLLNTSLRSGDSRAALGQSPAPRTETKRSSQHSKTEEKP